MTATVNGWRVITRAQCAVIDLPGGQLPVHPMWAPIFAHLGAALHTRVRPLVWPGTWGWAEPRPIRGKIGGKPTNHASGTAADFWAPQVPQGVPITKVFTAVEIDVIRHDIVPVYHGLIVWGGEWGAPDTDGMHFEGATGSTPEQVTALCRELAAPIAPAAPPPVVPAPAPSGPGWTGPDLTGYGPDLRGDIGNSGPRVEALQGFLRRNFPLYAKGLSVDGWWGPETTRVLYQFAQRSGIRSADGRNIGPQIARKLTAAGFR